MEAAIRILHFLIVLVMISTSSWGQSSAASKTISPQEIIVRLTDEQVQAAGIETEPIEPEAGVGEIVVPGTVSVPPQQLRIVAAPAAGLVETLLVSLMRLSTRELQ